MALAVIVAVPTPVALTLPLEFTVAMLGLLVLQVQVGVLGNPAGVAERVMSSPSTNITSSFASESVRSITLMVFVA